MLIEGFELCLTGNEVCKTTKESMHVSVIGAIEDYLGTNILEKPFYVFYTAISESKNADDFKVLAKDYHNTDLLTKFAKHLVKTKRVRYDISHVYTPDDEKFYIVYEDDFE